MDIETDELLTLLSDRVKAEAARAEAEQQRISEIQWLLKQQEYLLATIREFFAEIAQRIDDIELLILSGDLRQRSLQKQLAQELVNLNHLQEERARRGDESSVWLKNQIVEIEERIGKINQELRAE
jgi:hypothetical protein